MSSISDTSMVYDFSRLGTLKAQAAKDQADNEAIEQTAQQFEAMFIQMVMKSMRATIPEGGLLDSNQTKTFEQLLDQQFAMAMSDRRSTGISQMIEQFIRRSTGSIDSDAKEKNFPLQTVKKEPLPLIRESDNIPVSEDTTGNFLLRRQIMTLGGG
ncbi:MAG: rod-binding protein [Gammaproteobacteria bacterium]